MVPVGQRENKFTVPFPLVWRVRVLDDQWPAQSIRVLAGVVGVVPVCPRLVRLEVISGTVASIVKSKHDLQ